MLNKLRLWLGDVSVVVFILFCLFPISSWIAINGIWVELPLLVAQLPEGWDLPSYLVILIQVANVGPIIFTIAKKLAPDRTKEWPVVYIIIGIGIVACILLIFFWDSTTFIGGKVHSTALLTLAMFLSLVDCTSSVVFLPYMAAFNAQYLTAFYIGEGLSGLLPAVFGLIQGLGSDAICKNETTIRNGTESFQITTSYEPPNFSVGIFFVILVCLLCISAISFSFIHFHPYCQHHGLLLHTPLSNKVEPQPTSTTKNGTLHNTNDTTNHTNELDDNKITESTETTSASDSKEKIISDGDQKLKLVISCESILLLVVIGWITALTNGVLPSLQSYSCLPYGNLAYNLAVKLSVLANPIACLFVLFFQIRSVVALVVLAVVGTVFAVYQIVLASLSPFPPLYDQDAGKALVVVTYVAMTATFSYVKVCIACVLSRSAGSDGLLWCGGITQVGSFIGAVVIFCLVNNAKLFTSTYPCA